MLLKEFFTHFIKLLAHGDHLKLRVPTRTCGVILKAFLKHLMLIFGKMYTNRTAMKTTDQVL